MQVKGMWGRETGVGDGMELAAAAEAGADSAMRRELGNAHEQTCARMNNKRQKKLALVGAASIRCSPHSVPYVAIPSSRIVE
jgi:hypothetical protein